MDVPILPKKWPLARLLLVAGGVLLVGLLATSVFTACSAAGLRVDTRRLTISPVSRGAFQEFTALDGVVQPLRTTYLDAAEDGTVQELLVEESATLTPGQPILRLTNTNLQLEMVNRETAVFELMNNLQNTRNQLVQNRMQRQNQLTDLDFQLAEALLLVGLLLPAFNELTGKNLALTWDFRLVLAFLGIGLATGLLAGSYPAFYLSGFRPAAVLKGKLAAGAADRWTRQGLVVFQFTLSVLFIVAVLVINRQLAFVQRKSLGYEKQNVLYFETAGRAAQRPAAFLAEVQKLPGVVRASALWGGLLGERGPGR
ncbi:hypothetical protein HNQ93_003695 [Hymenobacter luteus]|uniref:Uncharacterized protein n=2 Tax=Hymenobacter TaxID=89966 RepID=A0A7W9T3I3_9BACT|nr:MULTISPECIES: hypothetical protein [Hymenobacter]MBB4602928.1 hypothetical protein [Hymenobacter latericoloratus]MBB6060820.1 hypothetical protein [Hymenobacter luteus]